MLERVTVEGGHGTGSFPFMVALVNVLIEEWNLVHCSVGEERNDYGHS